MSVTGVELSDPDSQARVSLEIEGDSRYPQEHEVALAAERNVERNVDFLVLNRASAAVSFDEFFEDYRAVRERSRTSTSTSDGTM